jgi:hypothetical protein
MNQIRQTLLFTWMAWVTGMCVSLTVSAQGPDDMPAKGKQPNPAAEEAAAGKKAAGKTAAGKAGGKPINLAPPEDPVITALLTSNPTTPSEIFRTAQLLLEAGRP